MVVSGLACGTVNSLWGYMFGTMRILPDGTLDPSFGAGGIALTNVSNATDGAWACAVQDGKVISAGYTPAKSQGSPYDNPTGKYEYCLLRYHPDGSLDGTFNRKGIVTTDFGGDKEYVADIALQGDGKIVATGWSQTAGQPGTFLTARYTPSGQLDTSFGGAGYVRTVFPEPFRGTWWPWRQDLRVLVSTDEYGADDGLLLVGNVYNSLDGQERLGLVRYDLDGNLDTYFGENGVLTCNLSGHRDSYANTAITDSQGNVLVGGRAFSTDDSGGHCDLTIARFNPDGSWDTTFGDDDGTGNGCGFAFLNLHSDVKAKALALQGDGKIVAAGWNGYGEKVLVARFNTDGTLDTSFDQVGYNETVVADPGQYAVSVLIQPDKKIVVVARGSKAGQRCTALARYLPEGTLDTAFGGSTPPATPGITVTPTTGLVTTEAGGTATFSVKLDSQPTAPVQIDVESENPAEGIVAGADEYGVLTLTFFDKTPQMVTVRGVDDLVRDGDQPYSVILDPAISLDPDYANRDPADVSVVNKDAEKGKLK